MDTENKAMAAPEKARVTCYLPLHKKGRNSVAIEMWAVTVEKNFDWGIVDFCPFAIEEESGLGTRLYEFQTESYNTITNEVFLKPYEIARSKSWPIERCLMGCGWKQKYTQRKAGVQ